jgi:antitoxin FitA
MASITIRNCDEALKRRLRIRAAQRGRSIEDEARDILRAALAEEGTARTNLADAMRRRIDPIGGIELVARPRGPMRSPPG